MVVVSGGDIRTTGREDLEWKTKFYKWMIVESEVCQKIR